MIKDLLLYFALLLWFVVPSQAQPTIFTEDVSGSKDQIVEVLIKVEDFNDVVALQFTFEWDSLVLEYVGVGEFSLVDLDSVNFGPAAPVNYLISTWYENQLSPVTVPNSDSIFSIFFKVIGEPSATSKLWFSGSVLPNLASINGQQADFFTKMAEFRVLETSNSTTTLPANFDLNISPNPFDASTQIKFFLENSQEDFTASIYSMEGKLLYHQVNDFAAGENSIEIEANLLGANGMYILHLNGQQIFTTHKLILENH